MLKTLKDITDGFKVCDTQSVQLTNAKYFFVDYRDTSCPQVGYVSRYIGGYEANKKWYEDENKFLQAIKRHLKKQLK